MEKNSLEMWQKNTAGPANIHLFECLAHDILVSVWSTIMWQKPGDESPWPREEYKDESYTQPVYRYTFSRVYKLKVGMKSLSNIDPVMMNVAAEDVMDIFKHYARMYPTIETDGDNMRKEFNHRFARILVDHMGFIYNEFINRQKLTKKYPNSVLNAKIELNVCEFNPFYKDFDIDPSQPEKEPELDTLQLTIAGDLVYDSVGTNPDDIKEWRPGNDGSQLYSDWRDAFMRSSAINSAPIEQVRTQPLNQQQTSPVSLEQLTAANRDILALIYLTEKIRESTNAAKYAAVIANADNVIAYYVQSINNALNNAENTGGQSQ